MLSLVSVAWKAHELIQFFVNNSKVAVRAWQQEISQEMLNQAF